VLVLRRHQYIIKYYMDTPPIQANSTQGQASKPFGRQIAVAVAGIFGAAVGHYCAWQRLHVAGASTRRSFKFRGNARRIV